MKAFFMDIVALFRLRFWFHEMRTQYGRNLITEADFDDVIAEYNSLLSDIRNTHFSREIAVESVEALSNVDRRVWVAVIIFAVAALY